MSGQRHAPAGLPSWKENRYPLHRKLGGPQGRSGGARKIGIPSPDRSARIESLNPLRCSYSQSATRTTIKHLSKSYNDGGRMRLKCDGTRAETRFRLSVKRTSPFKSAGASVLSTTGSRGVRISGSNAGYTMFRGSVKGTGYPLHSPVSPSVPLRCVTVCRHVSTGL